ncbi:MAG: HD domain-containing protein [Deltaproteobacteria bacterium]|nr:HD domain-containing protein [Deltaproteobacteria bacterium]
MAIAERNASSAIQLLTVGLSKEQLTGLAQAFEYCKATHIPMDINLLGSGAIASATEAGSNVKPDLIVVGDPPNQLSLDEIAQTVRMTWPGVTIFSVTRKRSIYFRKRLVKNGFNDAFLYPLEAGALRRAIYVALNKLTGGVVKAYRAVRVADLRVGSTLPCKLAIYLPVNDKYVHFMNGDVEFTAAHVDKLKAHRIQTVYVEIDELASFYAYALTGAKQRDSAAKMSMSERRHRFEDAAREVLGGLFRAEIKLQLEDGQKIVDELFSIIKTYLLDFPSYELPQLILGAMGQPADSYTHPVNVATYGALFAMALEIGNPVDVAMAGLLHDLGEVDVAEEVVLKPVETRNEEETVLYQKHVQATLDLLQEHKLTLTGPVVKAIYQHHEEPEGGGYPTGTIKAGLSKEAQLLTIADRFDYATRWVPGQPVLFADELLDKFRKDMLERKSHMPADPELVKKILGLFPKGGT